MFYGGELLDNTYQIIEEIGTGGTGIVYKAYHLRLKKYVVVKKLKNSAVSRDKIRVEVDILKRLHHTCLPQVYDFLETGGQVYTIMDYIEGEDLQHYLDAGVVFEEKQLIFWFRQLCDVLQYLHSRVPPILHSDIKPGNIMITPEGNVCLIDFNISLGGEADADILGLSKWYAAPEQYEKAQLRIAHQDSSHIVLDGQMDIYSLGASFYALMTGRLPDISSPDFLPLHSMELPYTDAFSQIVEKAMEISKAKRYPNAEAMGRALDEIYKMDAGYKSIQRQNWVLWGVCGTLVAAGILSCLYGQQVLRIEVYQKEYGDFYENAAGYEDESLITRGMQILNEKRYQDILEENPQDKAQILHIIGDAYYGQEEYETAIEYYEEAADTKPKSVYFRDWTVAAVRAENLAEAEKALRAAKGQEIEDGEIRLAQQETAFAKGKLDEVVTIGKELKESRSKEIAGYSCILSAKAYGRQGNYEKQAEYLDYAYTIGKDKRCLRELGNTFLEAAEHAEKNKREKYLQKAAGCYERLKKEYTVSYRDSMNLAVIWENLGEYEKAEKELKQIARKYSQEYEVYMHLTYVCLKEQEAQVEKDYSQVLAYFQKAEKKYRRAGTPEDSAMEDLESYMEMLKEEI